MTLQLFCHCWSFSKNLKHVYFDSRTQILFCSLFMVYSLAVVVPGVILAETTANRLKLNADKTELLFAGSSHSCAAMSGRYPVLQLGADTAVACSRVRLLGVDISSDLSLDHHVSRICAGCYYRLRQLRRIRRSLDSDSLGTLVYAAVHSRNDYCNTVLAGAPRTVTDNYSVC